MCLHGYAHYACGHIRRANEPCRFAKDADSPFYKDVACPNYKLDRKHVGTKCGFKDYYCSQIPDGPRISEAEAFLQGSEQQAQELDERMRKDTDMYRKYEAWARSKNFSKQDMLNYPGYQKERVKTQETVKERHALHLKQRSATQLITYFKDHIDDEPQEVGRNDDGTSIYSVFPVGFGEQTAAPNHQPGPVPLANAEQQQLNPYLLPGYAQQPAMSSNQVACQMYGPSHQLQTPIAPSRAYTTIPPQPFQFQQPYPQAVPQQPMQYFGNGPQGYNPPSGSPLNPSQRFEKEKHVRDLQAQYGKQLSTHQRNIARGVQPRRSRQMDAMLAPRDSHGSEADSVSAGSPMAKLKKKKKKNESPDANDEPAPLRRSTRARAKAVKYKESPESAGDPSSREQSPVKSVVNSDASDGYKDSPDKSESSSYSDTRGRKRRHLSEEVDEELDELNETETKKPGRGRPSLTNRIADYQKRSGAADAPVSTAKRRLKPSEYAQGGGGKAQSSMIDPNVYAQHQQFALRNAQYTMPTHDANNSYQQHNLPGSAVSYGGPGHGHIGRQQRHYSADNYAHPQPVRGQPSSMLASWPDDNKVTGAYQSQRRAPTAYDIYPNLLSSASNAYMGMGNQHTKASDDFGVHAGRAHVQPQPLASPFSMNPRGQYAGGKLDPALRQTQDTSQNLCPANGLGYPTNVTGHQTSTLGQFRGSNAALGQNQAQQDITIPSFRGSVTIPASSNLFNRHAAQSLARSAANSLAQIPNLPGYDPPNSIPPAYHFTANQTPAAPPSLAHYHQLRRSFDNTAALTPLSVDQADPAESTIDPTKKPTPISDDPSPRKRIRLSMPGDEGAPIWPAAWRKEQQQQENTDDPFLITAARAEDLNIDNPPDMDVLNSSFDPAAPQEQVTADGTDDLANVFLEAIVGAEANNQAEQAANVLMNLGSNNNEEGDVDQNNSNFE